MTTTTTNETVGDHVNQRAAPAGAEDDPDLIEAVTAGRWRLATLDGLIGRDTFAVQFLMGYGPGLPGLWVDVLCFDDEGNARAAWARLRAEGVRALDALPGEMGCEPETWAAIVATAPSPEWDCPAGD